MYLKPAHLVFRSPFHTPRRLRCLGLSAFLRRLEDSTPAHPAQKSAYGPDVPLCQCGIKLKSRPLFTCDYLAHECRASWEAATRLFTVRLRVMQRTVLLSEFCLSVRPSVCPSVRPSDACIVTKLNNVLRIF